MIAVVESEFILKAEPYSRRTTMSWKQIAELLAIIKQNSSEIERICHANQIAWDSLMTIIEIETKTEGNMPLKLVTQELMNRFY
jgi:hypothetical protein